MRLMSQTDYITADYASSAPAIQHAIEGLINGRDEPVLAFVLTFVRGKTYSNLLRNGKLTLEETVIPYVDHNGPMIGITIRYEFPVALPFVNKHVVIRKAAFERAWFGA